MQNQFYLGVVISFILAIAAGCSSTPDVVEEPPAQEAPPEPTAVQETIQEPVQAKPEPEIALETIFYFDYDDDTLHHGDLSAIKVLAKHINAGSQVIRIEGYADERGTEAYNQELGQRRANAVRDLLISMGVSFNRIETVSFGENNPVALGSDEAAWQKNRRVELKNI
jgi:peptidoglycan-associated lipoprotein